MLNAALKGGQRSFAFSVCFKPGAEHLQGDRNSEGHARFRVFHIHICLLRKQFVVEWNEGWRYLYCYNKKDSTIKVKPFQNNPYDSRSGSDTHNLNLGMIGQESIMLETEAIARR